MTGLLHRSVRWRPGSDGDIAFGLATGAVVAHVDRLRMGAVETVAAAVSVAVR